MGAVAIQVETVPRETGMVAVQLGNVAIRPALASSGTAGVLPALR